MLLLLLLRLLPRFPLSADFGTGQCTCLDGWASSNGDGGMGDRGDCGFRNEFCTDKTHEDQTREEIYDLLLAIDS